MAKYRKKPIEIEAIQWWPEDYHPDVKYDKNAMPYLETLEGPFKLTPGDWIITGIKGEKYPCKPDIFQETYEEI